MDGNPQPLIIDFILTKLVDDIASRHLAQQKDFNISSPLHTVLNSPVQPIDKNPQPLIIDFILTKLGI